ncbi:MAG: TetR/AcrR family transcriptional regulator [Lachnospiraceae bacterium]|nr:TetR/AcrR family transcriptional regulator [Lachnospiraceae bacterium]
MGRKTKITRDMILEAAYELLDESGISAVAIKLIADRLGCSTQPVSWQFGSMTELKKELYSYAAHKVFDGLEKEMQGRKAIEAFFLSGIRYLSIACDHPHVFRFLNVDDPMDTIGERPYGDASMFSFQFDEEAVKIFASQYDIPAAQIAEMVRDTVIYTHGLALMMIFDGQKLPKKEACRMVYNLGMKLSRDIGITPEGDFETAYNTIIRKKGSKG